MAIVDVFHAVLKKALGLNASDIHITVGSPFCLRLHGEIIPVQGMDSLTQQDTAAIAAKIVVASKRSTPQKVKEVLNGLTDFDCSYNLPDVCRFRVNICSQRGSIAIVLRAIPIDIPSVDDLGLPPVLKDISLEERGLILLTGITGSGKSTTLAAMIRHINDLKAVKIITIEDPIEFLHQDGKATIIQRELGTDTESFAMALRAALRQDPDVILVGEMRDKVTIDIALKAAETGHLVFSTVHTTDAPKTINRLLSVFDANEQLETRIRLAESLRAVVSQRLLRRSNGEGRVVAAEIMRHTKTIQDCIENPEKTGNIKDYVGKGREQYGMQTFDQHLADLYQKEMIDLETAKGAATSAADFERNLQFV
jgi:twitching motility protein PilT